MITKTFKLTIATDTKEQMRKEEEYLSMVYGAEEITESRWIPVSERLPEESGLYLVTLEYKEHGIGVTTLWYHGKQYGEFGWDLHVADAVIAWQPLPNPYEGVEE